MKASSRFIGVDFETSGLNPRGGHFPVQIGVSIFDDSAPLGVRMISTLIARQHPRLYKIDPDAMAVHGIPLEQLENAPSCADVDRVLVEQMADHTAEHGAGNLIAVGWNVGTFDMVFAEVFLPRFRALFSYRSFDLNAACMTIGGADYQAVKKSCYQVCEASASLSRQAGAPLAEAHDAGRDAWDALVTARHLWRMTEERSTSPDEILGL